MARNTTPDILEEIMGISKHENNKASKQAKNKEVKQVSNITTSPDNTKASKHEEDSTLSKEKATFNISTQTLEHLDEVWFKMKKMLKTKNKRITKTLIVETSIKKALDDFINHLEASEVFKEITKGSS